MKNAVLFYLSLTMAPMFAFASVFDAYVGAYTVISSTEKSDCQFLEASIEKQALLGGEAMTLRSTGKETRENVTCEIESVRLITVQGAPQLACVDVANGSSCTSDQVTQVATISETGEGVVQLDFLVTFPDRKISDRYVLRRK